MCAVLPGGSSLVQGRQAGWLARPLAVSPIALPREL